MVGESTEFVTFDEILNDKSSPGNNRVTLSYRSLN